jgi:fumarate reductase flavoprotein subunit
MLGAESDGPVQRLKPVVQRLCEILTSTQTPAIDAGALASASESLNQLSIRGEQLHCDETSLIANQNLLEMFRVQAAIRLGLASVRSAELRTESRGLHQRSDYPETDSEQLHHNLVYNDGSSGTLALRKGPSGNWILNPTSAV